MVFLILLLASALLLSPALINPDLIIGRPNDLQEFFWPLIEFSKSEIIKNFSLPLWNPHILSGTPLLPNPQAPLFYLPNIIFLALPIGVGFMVSIFIHIFLSGVFMYLFFKNGLSFSKFVSIFAAISYIFTPRLSAYLTAGHFGLICAGMYIPLTLLAVKKLSLKPQINWLTLYIISLTGLALTHTITFLIIGFVSFLFYLILIFQKGFDLKILKKGFFLFLAAAALFLGLNSVVLLPQIEWAPNTTRFLLLKNPDTHPKWRDFESFVSALFPTPLLITGGTGEIDTEQWISLGILTSILSVYGFTRLKNRDKLIISAIILVILLISLNNISPFYSLLIKQDAFKLMRVSTRVWIVVILISLYLSSLGLEALRKKTGRSLEFIIVFLLLFETLLLSWNRISFPVEKPKRASINIIKFLQANSSLSRVYCLNRCISQKDATTFGLELADGYDTIQQTNYYRQFWQFTGRFWDYYTLTLPPMGIYIFEKIQPDLAALGDYNVLYIVSPYEVTDLNLVEVSRMDGFIIYENKLAKTRFYLSDDKSTPAEIIQYSPNLIKVKTLRPESKNLSLSMTYSPGWKAFLNGTSEVAIQEKPNGTMLVDLKPDTYFVDFKYSPNSFKTGLIISSITLCLLTVLILKRNYVSSKI